jgi:hypothetical protein
MFIYKDTVVMLTVQLLVTITERSQDVFCFFVLRDINGDMVAVTVNSTSSLSHTYLSLTRTRYVSLSYANIVSGQTSIFM